jgi:hypothetical protein
MGEQRIFTPERTSRRAEIMFRFIVRRKCLIENCPIGFLHRLEIVNIERIALP